MAKHYVLALLCIMTQIMFSPAWAEVTSATTVTSTASQDAIQTFVKSDFAARRAMLNQWPASIEQLDQLVAYIDQNELYTDSAGNTYLLKNDDKLFSYPAQQAIENWPADLTQVTLVNTLRKALNFGQAKAKLNSTDASQRLAAVDILENNLAELDVTMVKQLYLNEKNDQVKARLAQLKARLDFNSADAFTQLEAVKVLADSNRPEVFALITQTLEQPQSNPALKAALLDAQNKIKTRLQISEWSGHIFSGLSTASILLLAALGLAITYGLLGVINMAHGELIMIGAYTTYVIQSFFKTHFAGLVDWYLLAAIPAAFLVSALIGMLIERTVIRPLYGRQLETLLATFGVSLILMQLVRMVFGAQNVEVSNVAWLSGGIALTPSLMLPYNRIAIIAFTVAVLLLLLFLLNKTRFGLFVRAVTQNRQMARAVGIRSARIDMMAFGLGSGLAGLAGCALAQVGNVGPDLGQNYIIDAFLVVVVGGVGQVWGAVLAALGLGISGTVLEIGLGAVLAKIILLVLVILFIQKRPQGLFAIKGRFVE
ncbi:urea ABC transporter, permease UrtB [Acinetobacter colistiniresistens]|uniref:Urea ABC transporter, permease UrtB n=1 Tax=Acinetobacter colistiniresistens TaxID=280145 RepID=N9R0X9_9GAMM|nr:urea ABC transporter permease subunit UrtB [Acinetobacter colistiniresistens]ENX35971.1 urea ABC transporter, permease UrtB [Acinetobacter colistiniresistens]